MSGRGWLLGCVIAALTGAVRAQIPGDWNSDGFVTPADAAGLETCMTGPGGTPSPGCVMFPVGRAWVGLRSAMAMQSAQANVGVCLSFSDAFSTSSRGYAGAYWYYNFGSGAQAVIDVDQPRLCGQPTSTITAASVAWIGMTDVISTLSNGQPLYWAQLGVATSRGVEPGGPTPPAISFKIYTEINAGWSGFGPPGTMYERRFWRGPIGAELYSTWVASRSTGRVDFAFGPQIHSYTHSGWISRWATRSDFNGETFNTQDQMPGTSSNHCVFSQCKFGAGSPTNFQDVAWSLGGVDIFWNPLMFYEADATSPTTLETWDLRILP